MVRWRPAVEVSSSKGVWCTAHTIALTGFWLLDSNDSSASASPVADWAFECMLLCPMEHFHFWIPSSGVVVRLQFQHLESRGKRITQVWGQLCLHSEFHASPGYTAEGWKLIKFCHWVFGSIYLLSPSMTQSSFRIIVRFTFLGVTQKPLQIYHQKKHIYQSQGLSQKPIYS